MGEDILFRILMIVVEAVIVIVGGYIIKYLKAKIGAEDLNNYYNLVKKIVMGVEQAFGQGNGADKKEEAIQLIRRVTKNKLSEDQVNSLIESAVFEMNNLFKSRDIIP